MEFEWDPVKSAANYKKHGVSFTEALELFGDPERIEVALSYQEERRFAVVGMMRGNIGLPSLPIVRGEQESSQ